MKKLIFLENGFEQEAIEGSNYLKRKLYRSGFPQEQLEQMEIISDFVRVDQDRKLEILFNKENVICTWSVYVDDSLSQLFKYLSSAGRNFIKNQIYIDGTGLLLETLNINFDETDEVLNIFNAIETNNILTYDKEDNLVRLRVELKGKNSSYFKYEPVNFLELIK